MLSLPPGTKVYLASKPVDMRKGFAGLSVLFFFLIRSIFKKNLNLQ